MPGVLKTDCRVKPEVNPLAHRLISAGAHGLRRIPGQSVNLAHLIWRTPRAPAPLPSGNKVHPRWISTRG